MSCLTTCCRKCKFEPENQKAYRCKSKDKRAVGHCSFDFLGEGCFPEGCFCPVFKKKKGNE